MKVLSSSLLSAAAPWELRLPLLRFMLRLLPASSAEAEVVLREVDDAAATATTVAWSASTGGDWRLELRVFGIRTVTVSRAIEGGKWAAAGNG